MKYFKRNKFGQKRRFSGRMRTRRHGRVKYSKGGPGAYFASRGGIRL